MDNLRIEYLPLTSLERARRNPKDHDIGGLDTSMNRFGFTSPLAINERTGRLVSGHGRLDTLQQRKVAGFPPPRRIKERDGDWYVPVLRGLDFDSDSDAEAYLLADNRYVEAGGWKPVELAEVLEELASLSIGRDGDNLYGTGWDEEDLEVLLRDIAPTSSPMNSGSSGGKSKAALEHTCPECGHTFY